MQSLHKWNDEMREVDIFMASLPRQLHVVETVKTILANKETKSITITANKYSDELFEELTQKLLAVNVVTQIPIYLYRGDNAKEANEKLKYVALGTGKYISFVDDDLLLAPNHFEYLISGCEKYNAYVSLHGVVLANRPLQSYYRDRMVLRGLGAVPFDSEVDIASNCGSLFKRSFFGNHTLEVLYQQAPNISMDDIIMGVLCRLNHRKCYVLKHDVGYMKHKVQYAEDEYCFDKYKFNDKVQTDYINKYWDVFK